MLSFPMNLHHFFRVRLGAAVVLLVLATSFLGTAAGVTTTITTTTATTTTSIPGPTANYSSWQQQVSNLPTPTAGCWEATYPAVAWVSGGSDCAGSSPAPMPVTVGNANDWQAKISSGNIGESQGYVSSDSGVTSESDSLVSPSGTNYYSLQDNSNFFTCNTSDTGGVSADCWEQFVYQNDPGASSGYLFIQYWLLGYIGGSITSCPSTHTGILAWTQYGSDCYTDSATPYSVPQENPSSLTSVQLKGYADLSGDDEAVFCHTTSCYAVTAPYGVLDLYSNWTYAEWNVLGYGGGSTACFNGSGNPCSGPSGSPSVMVEQYLYNSAGTNTASTCLSGGTTGETNSLTLGSCSAIVSPAPYYIYFSMT